MKDQIKRSSIILLNLAIAVGLFAGCRTLAPEPTPTITPTATLPPTATATLTPTVSLTPTQKPIRTATSAPVLNFHLGEEPVKDWHGIPIMPDAVEAEDDVSTYIFSIHASFDEIEAFYDQEMPALGYERLGSGTNSAGETVMLVYSKGAEMVIILLIEGSDSLTYVTIGG